MTNFFYVLLVSGSLQFDSQFVGQRDYASPPLGCVIVDVSEADYTTGWQSLSDATRATIMVASSNRRAVKAVADQLVAASNTVAGMSATLQASPVRLVSPSVEFLADEGPITLDQDGHKWITVADGLGDTMAVQISASPEVSKEIRKARINTKRADLKAVYDQVNALTDPTPQSVKVQLLWDELKARAKAAQ